MPRFVLLEHDWDGVHWDFFLERPDAGTLRAWAIDAPVVPDRDLPARPLPDHRAVYLDYEGAISGGRGVVRRLERGDYKAITWAEDRVIVQLAGAQLVGRVVLIETRSAGKVGESRPEGGCWTFRLSSGNRD